MGFRREGSYYILFLRGDRKGVGLGRDVERIWEDLGDNILNGETLFSIIEVGWKVQVELSIQDLCLTL